jgi:hypothetical protein
LRVGTNSVDEHIIPGANIDLAKESTMSETMPNQHVTAGEAHHHDGTVARPFSDAEWAVFRAEDFAAGKAVVVLMLGIFSMGVVLYSIVAYFVAY